MVIDDETLAGEAILLLEELGHDVIRPVRNAREAIRTMKKMMPDLVLIDLNVDGGSGFKVSRSLLDERPLPIILVVEPKDEILVRDEKTSGALTYSVKPLDREALHQAIEVAIARFEELTILRQEAQSLKDALESRKLMEKAKAVLMRRFEITEVEAFRRLRHESASQGKRLRELAEAVVLADKML